MKCQRFLMLIVLALALAAIACAAPAWAVTSTPVPTLTKPVPTLSRPTANASSWTAVVGQAVVNVRAERANTARVVGYLEAGDVVDVVQCVGSWCQIREPAGWVWRGCLSDNPRGLKCEARP